MVRTVEGWPFTMDNAGRRFGEKDMVTILRGVENNPLWRRAAQQDGFAILRVDENHVYGTMDSRANSMGLPLMQDYEAQRAIDSVSARMPHKLLEKYLKENYELHPEFRDVLHTRFFRYVSELDTLDMHIASTLKLCKVQPHDSNLGLYESVLEAEKELGNNPLTLRNAAKNKGKRTGHIIFRI